VDSNTRIALLEQSVSNHNSKIDSLQQDIKEVHDTLVLAKGGWRILIMMIAGTAGLLEIGVRIFEALFVHKG